MTDTAPIDCPPEGLPACHRHMAEIPALKRMVSDIHYAWMGDLRTGTPGMAEILRDLARRVSDLEGRTNRHSEKIHALQNVEIPAIVAASGNTAKRAWWEVAKVAIAGTVSAMGVWLALVFGGKVPHP